MTYNIIPYIIYEKINKKSIQYIKLTSFFTAQVADFVHCFELLRSTLLQQQLYNLVIWWGGGSKMGLNNLVIGVGGI